MGLNAPELSTDWNQAQMYQWRLHEISNNLANARRNRNFADWSVELWNFFSELSSQMTDTEIHDCRNALYGTDRYPKHSHYDKNRFVGYMGVETRLRTVMRDRGMLLPEKADPTQALMGNSF